MTEEIKNINLPDDEESIGDSGDGGTLEVNVAEQVESDEQLA